MEGPQIRDINELLTNGFFKTSTAKNPSKNNIDSSPEPTFLKTAAEVQAPRHRSRSRRPRGPPPPRPTVEDEIVSLSRESSVSLPSYDPPERGIIEQNPIILEAGVDAVEQARLQKIPCSKEDTENPERRFVLVPKPEDQPPPQERREEVPRKSREEVPSRPKPARVDSNRTATNQPPLQRRSSRQDLPSLETKLDAKVPRDIPPQFRRSASAAGVLPTDRDATPKAAPVPRTPRTPSGEYFLSPDASRNKDYFSQPGSRFQDGFGARGTTSQEKRHSGSSHGSRPGTPETRSDVEASKGRTRRGTNEKTNRPHQLADDGRKHDRYAAAAGFAAGVTTGIATGRSSRSSIHSKKQQESSEDDTTDSESDRYRRRAHDRLKQDFYGPRSPSRHSRSSQEPKRNSLLSSPMPSPKASPRASPSTSPRHDPFERTERAGTFPLTGRKQSSRPISPFDDDKDTPKAGRSNPLESQKLRVSNTAPQPKTSAPYPESLPIAIPGALDMPEPRRAPTLSQSQTRTPTQPHWAPPTFQPSANLDKPIGYIRRHSQEVDRGSIAPLPSCPRTFPVRGKDDWLTLSQCPSFDICPSCFASTIAPTEFRNSVVSARRPLDAAFVCDFGSSPWYRIAWLLTLKEKRRDLKLFYGLAEIAERVDPCLGKHEAVRHWHSIIDPKTGRPISGFDACYSCVKSIEILLPAVRGIFVRTEAQSSRRICDLRFDSKRFVQYFDALETAADRVTYDGDIPDTRALASLVKRFVMFDECQQDSDLIDRRWNVITQLPEFTVCEECFDEVVWPELEDGKAIPMMFAKDKKRIPRASCQLYSPKMRGIFRLAVDSDDYKLLAARARERKAIELAHKAALQDLRRRSGVDNAQRDIRRAEEEWKRWE